ncbi:MAG: putative membrane-bound dehydrogenase-like protein, partial [Gammaproteobacteria bacterium]
MITALCLTFLVPLGPTVPVAAPTELPQESSTERNLTDRFDVPGGLEVTLWAESPQLYNPTCMDVDSRGRVWVAEAVNYRSWGGRNPGRRHPEGDRIMILEDTNGDGVANSSKVFVQDKDLVAPIGLAVIGDSVYVSCSPNLFRYVDEDGDDVPDRRETFLTGFGGFDHDHGLHSIVSGPDGRLWFNAGNAGPHIVTGSDGWKLRSGSIYNGGGPMRSDNKPGLVSDDGYAWTGGIVLSINPDGSDMRVHAHNFRNIYEVGVDSWGNFFEEDNDDDGNRGCRTLWCLEYGDHGYFSADGTRTWRADRRPGQNTQDAHWHQEDPGVAPSGTINGGGGPTGVAVYEGQLLADAIGGALLNCDAGAGVVYAHQPVPSGAGVVMEPGELLRAKAELTDNGARWFRPSDVVVGTAGEVYVCDWFDPGVGGHAARDAEAYGRILRIAPTNETPVAPEILVDTVQHALETLANPAINVQALGRNALAKFIAADDNEVGAKQKWKDWFLADPNAREDIVRARMLSLCGGEFARATLDNPDLFTPALVEAAVRALRRLESLPPDQIRTRGLAQAESPAIRREVALALRGVALEDCLDILLDLAQGYDGEDRTYLEAFGIAAEGKEEALFGELAATFGDSPLRWDARFEGLAWRLHPAAAISSHLARATNSSLDSAARRRAIDALAFSPTREAANAMLTIALSGPEDLRAYALWWIDSRSTNDWRSYGIDRQVESVDMQGAELAWESGVVQEGLVPFEVYVEGADALWLVVTDGGDGNSCDWADWVNPFFDTAEGPIHLNKLTWISAEAQWGNVQVNRSAGGGAMQVGDLKVTGIGTHASSKICYAIPAGVTRLVGRAGPDFGGTAQGGQTSITFQIWLKRPPERAPVNTWTSVVLDSSADPDLRREAADSLARDPSGALRLIDMQSRGALPALVHGVVAAAIHKNPDIGVRALASEQFPVPGAQADYPSMSELVAMEGDPSRGRRVFQDRNRAQCATCHGFQQGDTLIGGDIGPELTRIREKYDRGALFDAILNPTAGIALGYEAWLIETKDGLLHNGFILADGQDLVLKDTQGFRTVIPSVEIVSRTQQSISTMPEGVALGLAPQELADLVAFLQEDPADEIEPGAEVVLFDGTSMDAWTYHLSDASKSMDDVWRVEDGVLKCEGSPAGYIRTKESYENYELSLDWRFDPARGPGNSGVLLRMV